VIKRLFRTYFLVTLFFIIFSADDFSEKWNFYGICIVVIIFCLCINLEEKNP